MGEVVQVGRFQLERSETAQKFPNKTWEKWSEKRRKRHEAVIEALKKKGEMKSADLITLLGVKHDTGYWILREMRAEGLIVRTRHYGYYQLSSAKPPTVPADEPTPAVTEGKGRQHSRLIAVIEIFELYEKVKRMEKTFEKGDTWLFLDEVEGASFSTMRDSRPGVFRLPSRFITGILNGLKKQLVKELNGTGLKEAKLFFAKINGLAAASKRK